MQRFSRLVPKIPRYPTKWKGYDLCSEGKNSLENGSAMSCLVSRLQCNTAHPPQTMPEAWLPVIFHSVGSLSAHKCRCTQSIYHAPLTMALADLGSWTTSICNKSKSWLSAVFWLLLADTLGSTIPWHRWQSRGSCQNYTTAQAGEVTECPTFLGIIYRTSKCSGCMGWGKLRLHLKGVNACLC